MAALGDGPLIVRSEADAWDVLERIVAGDLEVEDSRSVKISGWPRIEIELTSGSASITPTMMEGFVEFQKELYRSHMLLGHQTEDLRRLTREERKALEFTVQVRKGSSRYEVDLQNLFQQLGHATIDKMEPVHLIIVLLGAGVIWAGKTVALSYFQTRLEARKAEVQSEEKRAMLETQQFMTEQETRRMEVLAHVIEQVPQLEAVREHSDTGRHAMLAGFAGAEQARFNDIPIPGVVAEEIRRSPRSEASDVTVTGVYRVLRVDTTSPDGFRVRIWNVETEDEATVGVGDAVRYAGVREQIREAEWNKSDVVLTIKGRQRAGRLSEGVITGAEQPEKD